MRRLGPLSGRLASARLSSHTPHAICRRQLCAAAAEAKPVDTRPWFIRNWGTSLFLTFGSTWAYTLWVSNKARKAVDSAEEAVKARMPANSDELLELRALNDVPASSIGSLPARAAAAGKRAKASGAEVIQLLRAAVAAPGAPPMPLQEEYVIERMLLALPEGGVAGRKMDVRLATGALAFLSAGTVRERLEIMHAALVEGGDAEPGGDAAPGVPSIRLAPLLQALMATGQVPPEKCVCVEHEGRNVVGIERSWYRVAPVREYTAEEWAEELLSEHDASAAGGGEAAAAASDRIDFDRFVSMMESPRVCLWGECYQIAERRRLAKLKIDADEALRNPPFYRRAWNAIFGGG